MIPSPILLPHTRKFLRLPPGFVKTSMHWRHGQENRGEASSQVPFPPPSLSTLQQYHPDILQKPNASRIGCLALGDGMVTQRNSRRLHGGIRPRCSNRDAKLDKFPIKLLAKYDHFLCIDRWNEFWQNKIGHAEGSLFCLSQKKKKGDKIRPAWLRQQKVVNNNVTNITKCIIPNEIQQSFLIRRVILPVDQDYCSNPGKYDA